MRSTPLIMTSAILVEHHSITNAGTLITVVTKPVQPLALTGHAVLRRTGTLPSTVVLEIIIAAEISVDLTCMIASLADPTLNNFGSLL